jgi:ParB family chromosome partitioning protein
MADDQSRNRLGRGLAALIGDMGPENAAVVERGRPGGGQRKLPIELIRPNPRNPRRAFHADDLEELAKSIREKGIVQPIVVRPVAGAAGTAFEIIAGERRWRAAQSVGMHEVPVVVLDVDDKEALELAIIENVQRADLNPIEEGLGYQRLISEFSYSQGDLAKVIGKSRPHVANTLSLLKLPEQVQSYLREGRLTAGHARALINAEDPLAMAKRIVETGLSVRQAETLRQSGGGKTKAPRSPRDKDADTRAIEKSLSDRLGLTVTIDHGANGGTVTIAYKTLEQLDDVCRRLQTA